MTREEMLSYCLAKPGAWRDQPWESDEVIKVGSRIFAFLGCADGDDPSIGVKCGPSRDVADEWLHRYPDDARPLPYLGRSGWNSLRLAGGIDEEELIEAVDASFDAVVAKLPKRERPAG